MDNRINARALMSNMRKSALGGRKIPHGVSNPVFRKMDDGSYAAAAFVFLYSRDDLKNRTVKRPSRWITADIKTGQIISEYSCKDIDFSSAAADAVCSLDAADSTVYSKEYVDQTLAVFDLIMRKYNATGIFDRELNDVYMYMMLKMVSVGFKEFYRELNKI